MKIRKDYKDQAEKDQVETEMKGKARLIEDCHHFDGTYLLFDDSEPPRDLAKEFDNLVIKLNKVGIGQF